MSRSRQIAVIMFTDIVGYTALMGKDESRALGILAKNKSLHQRLLKRFDGKFLKEMGDGILASFPSVTDAVYCANTLLKEASDLQELNLRIGIHLGEVVVDGKELYGDGVNIASRIEGIAEGGQMLVSETIYKNIKNRKGIKTAFLGEHMLKNVDEPLRIYSVHIDEIPVDYRVESTVSKKKAFSSKFILAVIGGVAVITLVYFLGFKSNALPDSTEAMEKSIAVLPFKVIGDDEEGKSFALGVWDVLIGHLTNVEALTVRSRTSVERFANPTSSIKEIAEMVNANYIIEGSAQKYDEDIRIIVKLTDARTDDNLWQQTFVRKYEDIFQVQSEIALSITEAFNVVIVPSAREELLAIPTQNKEAWDLYTRGNYYRDQYWKSRNPSDIDIAIDFYDQAFQLDSLFAEPLIAMANAVQGKHWFELDKYPNLKDSIFQMASNALRIDPENDNVLRFLGLLHVFTDFDYEGGINFLKKAIVLDPRDQNNYYTLSFIFYRKIDQNHNESQSLLDSSMVYAKLALEQEPANRYSRLLDHTGELYHNYGNFEMALAFYNEALNFEPDNFQFLGHKMYSELFSGEYEKALTTAQRSVESNRNDAGLVDLGKVYLVLNRLQEAEDTYRRFYSLSEAIHADANHERHAYAHVLRKNGKEAEALKQIEISRQWIVDRMNAQPYDMAKVYAFLGEKEKALDYIEQFTPWWGLHVWIEHEPLFEPLREEPRFQAVVDRCKVWGDSLYTIAESSIASGRFPRLEQLEYN